MNSSKVAGDEFDVHTLTASSIQEIRDKLFETLGRFRDIFPKSKDSSILLKPNLNSNMNALTGNTTDMRILAAVIEFLKSEGYRNITIGEGTNSGFYRNNISVISHLKVDALAKHYGVRIIDLNYSEKMPVEFENGVTAYLAKECLESDFLINMPKLKTHFEAGMSVCLKNMMGCLIGQENKKKTHKSLARNILNINKIVKPGLHIVDGLIAMEGLGPTRGTPVRTGVIFVGKDPYILDLACCKLAGFDYRKVKTLKQAEDDGLLGKKHHDYVRSLELPVNIKVFDEPIANPFVSFIHSPKRQSFFMAIRNTYIFNYLCSTKFIGKILFLTGLRQDNFINEEMNFEGFGLKSELCRNGCVKCADYCPIMLKLPEGIENSDDCIDCMYCYLVCPERAIEFKGKLGFLKEQLRQYDDITRSVT